MNVRNLKQMFERRTTIKEQQTPKKEPENRPKVVTQPFIHTPSINFSYQNQNKHIQQPRVSVASNKHFLQQLNKKLERNSTASRKTIVQQQSEKIERRHQNQLTKIEQKEPIHIPKAIEPTHKEEPQPSLIRSVVRNKQTKTIVIESSLKKDKELNMDDIISGIDRGSIRQGEVSSRYGMHQNYSTRSREKTLSDENISHKGIVQNSSFSELLQNMVQSLNKAKPENQERPKTQQFYKNTINNKLIYDQTYKTAELKLKRIDFVLNVVFGNEQFEKVISQKKRVSMDKPKRVQKKVLKQKQRKEILIPNIRQTIQTEIVVEEIVKKKDQQNQQNTLSSTVVRPSMASNQFLNQLTSKIFKKSMDTAKLNLDPTPTVTHPPHRPPLPIKKQIVSPVKTDTLVPRQKKKARAKRNFDDF